MIIPKLHPSKRIREFNTYSFIEKSRIVKQWLFSKDKGHRELDRDILELDPDSFKGGWQSGGVLRFLGLTGEFKGIFQDLELEERIKKLRNGEQDFSEIINFLEKKKED